MQDYRLSKYNIFVPYQGKHLLFNGMSGALLGLDKNAKELLDDNDPKDLSHLQPELYEALKQTRCLIPENAEEMDPIKMRNRNSIYENKSYHLTINPTMNCNFKCWYCYEGHVKSKMDGATQDNVYKHVAQLINKKAITGLELGWFGGEPLMTFSNVIQPLAKRLKVLCENSGIPFVNRITTNGYLISHKHLEKFKEIDLSFFQITLDGNRERHNGIRYLKENERPTFDRVVENINHLASQDGFHVNMRINFQDETLEEITDIITLFPEKHRKNITVDFQRVWQTCTTTAGPNHRLKDTIRLFTNAGFVAHSASNDFVFNRAHRCYADRRLQAVINYDGNIFKCTARDFSEANREGILLPSGEIQWDQEKIDARFKRAPWERERCMDCGLLPLCMGPCSQQMLELGEENRNSYCWLDNLELTVEDYVISRYEAMIEAAMGSVSV